MKNMFDVQGPTIGAKTPDELAVSQRQDMMRMDYESVLGTPITGYVGYQKGDLDPVTGGVFDSRGRAVNEDGSAALNDLGTRSYSSAKDWVNDMKAGQESGWRGGPISEAKYNSLTSVAKNRYDNYAEITGANSYRNTRSVAQINFQQQQDTEKAAAEQAAAQKAAADAARKAAADAARTRYNNTSAFYAPFASGNQSARDKGIAGLRGDGFESSGRAGAETASRDLGVGMASRGKAKGGVATKKMKRGGLASKK
jgi:hypothetical protein